VRANKIHNMLPRNQNSKDDSSMFQGAKNRPSPCRNYTAFACELKHRSKKTGYCIWFDKKQGNSSELLMMTNVYCSASYLLYEEGREMIIRPHRRLSYYYSLSPNSGIICLEAYPCLPAEKSKMSLRTEEVLYTSTCMIVLYVYFVVTWARSNTSLHLCE
jgi:hypothetical protein